MNNATLCLLVRGFPPNAILLGLKKKGFGRDKYNGFGGKVEPGETVLQATIREVAEEVGIQLLEKDVQRVAHLTFLFPSKPAWNQVVHVFMARKWSGVVSESPEMRPVWFNVSEIPFDRMWADDQHWMPRVLTGERVRGSFTFASDNETIQTLEIEPWDGREIPGIYEVWT